MPVHTTLGASRLYNVVYGNVFYTVAMIAINVSANVMRPP